MPLKFSAQSGLKNIDDASESYSIYKQIITDEILDIILETNIYAAQLKAQNFKGQKFRRH